MKKITLIITTITALVASGYCQVDRLTAKIKNGYAGNNYLIKSKQQKKAGWILLGGGTALTVIGLATFPKDYNIIFGNDKRTESKADVAGGLIIAGGLSMLGSIPLFIVARKNKTMANLTVAMQKTALLLPVKTVKVVTGITLSIPL